VHNLKVAAAQITSKKGDIETNITTHLKAIERASELGVDYLVFPELSITGYEPELAYSLAFYKNDKRLQPIIDSAIKNKIYVGIGAPLSTDDLPQIGLFVISKTGDIEVYAKMHLHPGEEAFFKAGEQYHLINIGSTKIANAICADTNNSQHAKSCAALGADVYIAGVLITSSGYDEDTATMERYARDLNMLVGMANHNQPTGGHSPVGKSAFWSSTGLLARADETQNALILAEKVGNHWVGEICEI
jgi:predicted amidohydrolase